MAKYGYIGNVPTQASGSNSGIFDVTDVTKLLEANQWTLQTADITYLVVAGGGAGGYDQGGGGGAGGLLESTGTADLGTSYSITIGSGGANTNSPNVNGSNGANSVLNLKAGTITATGGV